MPSKERLSAFAGQVKKSEEFSPDEKFIGGRGQDERVPQRYSLNVQFFIRWSVDVKTWNWNASKPLSIH